jgi:hypothetical protein
MVTAKEVTWVQLLSSFLISQLAQLPSCELRRDETSWASLDGIKDCKILGRVVNSERESALLSFQAGHWIIKFVLRTVS